MYDEAKFIVRVNSPSTSQISGERLLQRGASGAVARGSVAPLLPGRDQLLEAEEAARRPELLARSKIRRAHQVHTTVEGFT
jgi:hypothetical protein